MDVSAAWVPGARLSEQGWYVGGDSDHPDLMFLSPLSLALGEDGQ